MYCVLKKIVFVSAVLCVSTSLAAKFPKEFSRCNQSKSDFETCLSNAITSAVRVLATGLPKFGIPSIDPVLIPELSIGAGSNAVNLEQKYMNVKLIGYKNAVVKSASFDMPSKTLKFSAKIPNFVMEGDYEMAGRVLVLPVRGKGKFSLKLDDVTVDHLLKFTETQRKSNKYLTLKTYDIKISANQVTFKFENLFDGNKELSDALHKVINDNWKIVFEDVISGYEKAYAAIFSQYAKAFFNRVPLKEVFPQ